MRPPEPRRESARYIQYLRSVQTLFEAQALTAAEDGSLTRAELEQAWASATAGAKSFLEHVAARLGNDNAMYWRKLAKGRPVPPATGAAIVRSDWVRDNLALIADIGAKQIDEILSARRDAAWRDDAREPARVSNARKANVALIGGTNLKQHLQLTEMFRSAQAKGERHETLVERVQGITGAGFKRAKLIARDQTVKHNAVIRQETARSLGITHYIWRDSGDEAVRPFHKRLRGKKFAYADPPVTDAYGHRNNPGEDYNCRCVDEPVVDLFAGLSGPDLSGSLKAQGKLGPKPKAPARERAPKPEPAPRLGKRAQPLLAGVNEQDLTFLRTGYRDPIFPFEGAAPEQVNAIATGAMPPVGSRNALPPITISVQPNANPVLVDGRHRLEAAQAAGATKIRARIVEYDSQLNVLRENIVTIPVPKPDAEKLKRLAVRPKKP